MKTYKTCVFENTIYEKVTKYLFPAILLIYAYLGVNRGIDITDVGYNLGNYKYISGLDGMWYYSTLLANLLGAAITHLPFGQTMLGVSVYCATIKAIFALCAYVFFVRSGKILREAAFLGMFTSLSLCWAPQVCLYHYLSYYAFFVIAAIIFIALTGKKKENLLILAGVLVALSILIRFPNICYMALIVPVWWHSFLVKDKFFDVLRKTVKCIIGVLVTLIIVVYTFLCTGRMGEYIKGIKELFSMTDESERYGIRFTIVNLINSYTCIWYWLIPIALASVLLMVLGLLKFKGILGSRVLYNAFAVLGMAVIYLWYKKTLLFDYDFTSYSSMYLFGVVILTIMLILFVITALCSRFSDRLRLLSALAIVIQMITPFGTNNSLYVVLNSLFFLMPVAFMIIAELARFKPTRYLHTGLVVLFLFFSVQMAFFYKGFTFREKQHEPQDTYVEGNAVLKGMRTTASNAALLMDLTDLWNENGLTEYPYEVLTFGEMPGIAYYMSTKPALSSTWPTLDSYSVEKFTLKMKELGPMMSEKGMRYVIVTDDSIEREGAKQEILKNFINENGYITIYDDRGIKVWLREGDLKK